MAKKRGHGDGSITYREGRAKPWLARTSKASGKALQTRNFATKQEATVWLRQVGNEMDEGTYTDPSKLSLAQWMTTWLETYKRPSVEIRTYEGYASINRLYITPTIGHIELQKLQPVHIQTMLNSCAEEELSKRTLQYIVATLRPALKQALRDGLVTRNAAEAVSLPKSNATPTKKRALSRQELTALFDICADEPRLNIAVRIMAGTGVRIGELLGLRWDDIDMQRSTMNIARAITTSRTEGRIVKQPKTSASIRAIPLPAALVEALQAWKIMQIEERLQAGADWQDTAGAVMTMQNGSLVRAEWISGNLRKRGAYSAHELRHTYATLLVENGVDLKTVQELLGHATTRMVMEVYAHSNDEAKRKAVEALGL